MTFWINPAANKFETVKVLKRDEHMTRVVRANGTKVWVPNHTLTK